MHTRLTLCFSLLAALAFAEDAPLPPGVKAVWDLSKATHEKTATRERVCLNGLWRWQPVVAPASVPAGAAPAVQPADKVPSDGWGFFKVPGCWPGITDYQQKDCQTVFAHPSWKNEKLGAVTTAWYQRELTIPADWAARRIVLNADCVNSLAVIFVDGVKAGEIRYPAGEADLSSVLKPGSKHVLSLMVTALPLKAVMLSFNDTAHANEVKGSVKRRGLCGDVFLEATPKARITDVKIDTSVRKRQTTLDVAVQGLEAKNAYYLEVKLTGELLGGCEPILDVTQGRYLITVKGIPTKLWDIHTPQNMCEAIVSLRDMDNKLLDQSLPLRFGFREFWIDGRDFYLNGTRIYLSAVPIDNAAVGAAWASYDGAKESLSRLKSFGINFVYTHNYGCEPGSHLAFNEILRAADDVGMLVSFSQPHFSAYDWKAPDADEKNGYARHAEHYIRLAQNHPSVVFYSMNHNSTGYGEDMNPDMLGDEKDPRDTWAANNAKLALRAEAIVKRLDPSRIVYHHASGNLGSMHNSNFYPNFTPIQEMSDWFGHWATAGTKPMFTCEYGAPFTWDWSMYRGWYKGQRSFGNANVQWEFCFAEWNAQFLGDKAFQIGEPEKANLRFEAKKFRSGATWHRWDYPFEIGSRVFDDRHTVLGMYTTDNWRAFRTWGLSGNSPWEHSHFWRLRDGMNRNALTPQKVDWDNLQKPGFSADFVQDRYETFDLAYDRTDWIPTPDAQALLRNNMPLLAYIAGPAAHFTSKEHNYWGNEPIEKQLIIINNSREKISCECSWLRTDGGDKDCKKQVSVNPGDQEHIPLRFNYQHEQLLPAKYELQAICKFSNGETQTDSFTIHLLRTLQPMASRKLAAFDPKGETTKLLASLGVTVQPVDARSDLSAVDLLILGKGALTADGPAPDLSRVRDGLKVIVFEQSAEALGKRLGFRVAEYGLRQVYPRIPDHPLLAGLNTDHLRDWRGEATLSSPKLKYELSRKFNGSPAVKWCDIEVTRAWRCGCRGNVASVLIEKPACGDFLPILDGGYSLQYSPLLQYREGNGMILFCQMDVTGRTETDPAAQQLARNIIDYAANWKPSSARKALYAGDPNGKAHLEKCGFALEEVAPASGPPLPREGEGLGVRGLLAADQVLIVAPGGAEKLAPNAAAIAAGLKAGARVLALGLNEKEANAFLPQKIQTKKAEHIASYFDAPNVSAPFAGIGPADVHNRDPHEFPLISGGDATPIGDGILASGPPLPREGEGLGVRGNAGTVFCQLLPWTYDYSKQYNLKRTFRRTSFLVTRLLANMGCAAKTPLLDRFAKPVDPAKGEKRFLDGLYLDVPEEMDDPYRFFRW
ncbi:MAG TPA: glycoside hydrolase family 2 TIM barrel-domain containing protein [Planctomycetota bacterium]|jgi:hypothetical protein